MCMGHGLNDLLMYKTNDISLHSDGALWNRNKMADMFADDISEDNFKYHILIYI